MALQLDSLVTDLMFQANAAIDQKTLIDGLGGETALETKQLLDVDRLDPRAEMELSPSMPFRRRTERRLMIIDDTIVTPRADPGAEPIITNDLRAAKEQLIDICAKLPIRLGRLFVLGTWGDAVIVARSVKDLRAIALLPWALDPQVDETGKRRQTPLSQKEFESKLMTYEKRLEELDEEQILARLDGVNFERNGELVIVDALEPDGTWDQRKSMAMEMQLGAWDSFSMIAGAPSTSKVPLKPGGPANGAPKPATAAAPAAPPKPAAPPPPPPKPEPVGPPLAIKELENTVLLVFPAERFNLEVASALGKSDWDNVVRRTDNVSGAVRDKMQRDGANWVAPLEFLSEVFIDGKPLTKQQFEKDSQPLDGLKSMSVHFPRFGEVVLFEVPGKGRFVTSLTSGPERAVAVVK
ncbi:hypothetical protein BH11MYX1_BH11MYX1_07170 [soil metagenome]